MPKSLSEAVQTIVRIGTGILFLQHGLQKTFGLFGGVGGGTAPLLSRLGAAGIIETVGGVLIIAGLFTRRVAVVLLGEMLVAYWLSHYPRQGWPIQNGGELALLYAMIFAALAVNGGGRLSIDSLRGRR